MFSTYKTSLKTAGVLNSLVQDFVEKKETVRPFYGTYPDLEGFRSIVKTNRFSSINRNQLHQIVLRQALLVENTNQATLENITHLQSPNSYTVTTGHQLCLFTGPLYFLHKIFSVINLAEELTKEFPENKFIPVYWAASEDHDFEEVNHFHVFGKKITWESNQSGAVGDFKTNELEVLLPQLKEIFGSSENADKLVSLFENAYLKHSNLADATRFLVNELFGKYGLVTVDGNDKDFKIHSGEIFKKDIYENLPYLKVSESIARLSDLSYKVQVNPREINSFYMDKGLRLRIEKKESGFVLAGSDRSFTNAEMNDLIKNAPDKISPNVVLRPLYQQTILPNIAYVGGPGELAYWLEYKTMFDAMNIEFPVLVPRAFVTLIDKSVKSKADKLGLGTEDLFSDEQELIKIFQVRSDNVFDVNEEKLKISALFSGLSERIGAIDKTLVNTTSAEQQKVMNSLDALSAKANRALKQRLETEMNQLRTIREKLYPGNVPQERYENFAVFYVKWGEELFRVLKNELQPLALQHYSIIEE